MKVTRRSYRQTFQYIVAGLLVMVFATSAFAQEKSPMEVVKARSSELTTILGEPDTAARTERVNKALYETVDFGELATRALGKHWTKRTDAERAEFLDLLQRLLQANYSKQISGRKLGKDYTLEYGDERIRDDRAVVKVTVKYDKKKHPVLYRLTKKGNNWVVYDLVIDDVSLEETYREGYVPIIEEDGWDGLIDLMKERLAEFEKPAEKAKPKKAEKTEKAPKTTKKAAPAKTK